MLNYINLLSLLLFFNKTNKCLNISNWKIQFREKIFPRGYIKYINYTIVSFDFFLLYFLRWNYFFRLYILSLSFMYMISYFFIIIGKILKIDIGNWRWIHSCAYTELIVNFNFQQISNSRVDIYDLLGLWRSLRDVIRPIYRCNKSHSMFK